MLKVIVHIGYPKCGSSALQHFLCHHPVLQGTQRQYRYFVISIDGVMPWRRVEAKLKRSVSGYVASSGSLANAVTALVDHYEGDPSGTEVAVISEENWGSHKNLDELGEAAETFSGRVSLEVVAFVRPQISWMQSAWWQWFAWKEAMSIEDMWLNQRHNMKWARRIKKLQSTPLISSVTVRLHDSSRDITRDFLRVLDVDPSAYPAGKNINLSLSAGHIAVYRRLPFLRRPEHSRKAVLLDRLLPSGTPAPWAIPRPLAERIVSESREDNETLAGLLDPESREQMLGNPQWWSADAYARHWPQET